MRRDASFHLVTDVLPFQLVSVNAGDDADTPAMAARARLDAVFANLQPLIHGQANAGHRSCVQSKPRCSARA